MTHVRRPTLCSCDACARLDLNFPGEGAQLALPVTSVAPRRRRRTQSGERP